MLTTPEDWCRADLTYDGVLDVFDVFAYLKHFENGSAWANMTVDQAIDVFDVFAYLDLFAAGCP